MLFKRQPAATTPLYQLPLESQDRAPRRWVRWLANLLIAIGVLALIDVVVTMVWQEPITAIYTEIRQSDLHASLAKLQAREPELKTLSLLAVTTSTKKRIALLAAELEERSPSGAAVGEIRIPAISATYTIVKGTGEAELASGPGIYNNAEYPGSRFPGNGDLTAIAGHRTTFLAPFRHIDRLHNGEPIVVEMPYGRFEYVVVGKRTVSPENLRAVLSPPSKVNLVLSSCNPPFSAAERILVYASLRSVLPKGQALAYQRELAAQQAPASTLAERLGLPSAAPAVPPFAGSKA
jgi:sortase A